jgi:hypothetical protein
VPEAIFVRAHAASNYKRITKLMRSIFIQRQQDIRFRLYQHTCSWGKSSLVRNCTNLGTTPDFITSSMGGLLSGSEILQVQPMFTNSNRPPLINKLRNKNNWKESKLVPIESNLRNCVVASS